MDTLPSPTPMIPLEPPQAPEQKPETSLVITRPWVTSLTLLSFGLILIGASTINFGSLKSSILDTQKPLKVTGTNMKVLSQEQHEQEGSVQVSFLESGKQELEFDVGGAKQKIHVDVLPDAPPLAAVVEDMKPAAIKPCFPDLKRFSSSTRQSICSLADKKILKGRPNGRYDPEGQIDRAQMATIMMRVLNYERKQYSIGGDLDEILAKNIAVSFPDVVENEWYAHDVLLASQAGLISGDHGGHFRPIDFVNYAEAIKMIIKVAILVDPKTSEILQEEIAKLSPDDIWYLAYVRTAERLDMLDEFTRSPFENSLAAAGNAPRYWIALVMAHIAGL